MSRKTTTTQRRTTTDDSGFNTPAPASQAQNNGIPTETPAQDTPRKKTVCPVSRQEFDDAAQPVTVVIDGQSHVAEVKTFSTGSFGWYLSGKTTISVGGKRVTVQVGMSLTAIGSKELPQG